MRRHKKRHEHSLIAGFGCAPNADVDATRGEKPLSALASQGFRCSRMVALGSMPLSDSFARMFSICGPCFKVGLVSHRAHGSLRGRSCRPMMASVTGCLRWSAARSPDWRIDIRQRGHPASVPMGPGSALRRVSMSQIMRATPLSSRRRSSRRARSGSGSPPACARLPRSPSSAPCAVRGAPPRP